MFTTDKRRRFLHRTQSLKLQHLRDAVQQNQVTGYPPFVEEFERDFARYVGCRHGVTFCNGTSTLEAALFALGVGEGDEVLVPAYTFHASIDPILNAGARPVYLDIDRRTQTLDPSEIDRRRTPATRAILVVHMMGNPAPMDAIMARATGLGVVEDCSHAHGATWGGRKVGSFGQVGCFSLQGSKPVSAGEGGIAVTDREDLWRRLNLFGHFGRGADGAAADPYAPLAKTGMGFKRRANPLGLCMARVDLQFLDEVNAALTELTGRLAEIVAPIPWLTPVASWPEARKGGFFYGMPVRIERDHPRAMTRDALLQALTARGLEAKSYPYHAYHRMPHMVDGAVRRRLLYPGRPLAEPAAEPVPLPDLPHTDEAQAQTLFLSLEAFADDGWVKRWARGLPECCG